MTIENFKEVLKKNGVIALSDADAMNIWNTAVGYVENHIIENLPASISDKLSIRDGGEIMTAIRKTGMIDMSKPKVVTKLKPTNIKRQRSVGDREREEAPDHY